MNLFHKYYNRAFLFALELIAQLQGGAVLTQRDVLELAQNKGVRDVAPVVQPLIDYEIIAQDEGRYRLNIPYQELRLPLQYTEKKWLAYMLTMPEAQLLLDTPLYEHLQSLCGGIGPFAGVQRYEPIAAMPAETEEGEKIQLLLQAIRERRMVRYQFRTRDDPADQMLQKSETLPWKLEYSAFDHRWWVIVYLPEEKRTVKAKLENMRAPELGRRTNIPESEIEQAMERLMEPEPVTLAVSPDKGAVERCFLVFENQQFEETKQISKDHFALSFRWYRFDEQEILRRLLYLGPMVKLLGPKKLQKALAEKLKQALEERERTPE